MNSSYGSLDGGVRNFIIALNAVGFGEKSMVREDLSFDGFVGATHVPGQPFGGANKQVRLYGPAAKSIPYDYLVR